MLENETEKKEGYASVTCLKVESRKVRVFTIHHQSQLSNNLAILVG